MADFTINIPDNLSFQEYLHVVQVARTWADGYVRKDATRLRASLASSLTIDYSGIVPTWGLQTYTRDAFITLWLSPDSEHRGLRPLATQHLLSLPYFKSVSASAIVVEWQIIASHGRRAPGEDAGDPVARIEEERNDRGFLEHGFVWEEGGWRVGTIRPRVIFQPGDFMSMRRPE